MKMTSIFKYVLDATQSWVKPLEAHSLKCFFSGFINLTLLLFIQNCFLKGRLVDLPNQILIDFSQVTVWLYSMVCLFKFYIELKQLKKLAIGNEALNCLCESCLEVLVTLNKLV